MLSLQKEKMFLHISYRILNRKTVSWINHHWSCVLKSHSHQPWGKKLVSSRKILVHCKLWSPLLRKTTRSYGAGGGAWILCGKTLQKWNAGSCEHSVNNNIHMCSVFSNSDFRYLPCVKIHNSPRSREVSSFILGTRPWIINWSTECTTRSRNIIIWDFKRLAIALLEKKLRWNKENRKVFLFHQKKRFFLMLKIISV